MKRVLLICVAFMVALFVCRAEEVTLAWENSSVWESGPDRSIVYKQAPYELRVLMSNGPVNPYVASSTNDVRTVRNNIVQVMTRGENMTKIVFKVSEEGKKRLCELKPTSGEVSVDTENWLVTWTGDAVEVSFTVGEKSIYGTDGSDEVGQFCFESLVITDAQRLVEVTPPVISPEAGIYKDEVEVSLQAEAGLDVYYTTDGSEPTLTATRYEAPFKLTETAEVKAIAADADGNMSEVVTAKYEIKASPKVPENGALFNFNENKWEFPVSDNSQSFELTTPIIENGVMMTFTSGNTPTRLWKDSKQGVQLRVYSGGGGFTLMPSAGAKVTKIEFDASEFDMSVNVGEINDKVWTGTSAGPVFKANATCKINYIIVTIDKNTGIEGVENETTTEQIIYSIDGRRLQQVQKGVVIVNGKKVLVK